MLDLIRSLFSETDQEPVGASSKPRTLEGAAAALMIEAACLDGHFEESERAVIRGILCSRFGLDEERAEALIDEGHRSADDSAQIYNVVRIVRESLNSEERIEVIEMLWEVAYADGTVHDYEANLVRRIAGLLYVPDQHSGAARKRVLDRLTAENAPGS